MALVISRRATDASTGSTSGPDRHHEPEGTLRVAGHLARPEARERCAATRTCSALPRSMLSRSSQAGSASSHRRGRPAVRGAIPRGGAPASLRWGRVERLGRRSVTSALWPGAPLPAEHLGHRRRVVTRPVLDATGESASRDFPTRGEGTDGERRVVTDHDGPMRRRRQTVESLWRVSHSLERRHGSTCARPLRAKGARSRGPGPASEPAHRGIHGLREGQG